MQRSSDLGDGAVEPGQPGRRAPADRSRAPRRSDPVAITLGGLQAARIELDVPSDRPRSGCRLGRGGLQVWRSQGDDYFVLFPDERASVYVVDVAGRALVFVTKSDGEVSAADRAEVESIMGSIRFEG